MKVVDSLLNRSEDTVERELLNIAADNGMRVFSKPRLADVIDKENTRLTIREFDFYTRSHCDFVLTDPQTRPLMIVEYDGPLHQTNAKQQERDKIKNELCRRAGIDLLRIHDRHVSKLYRDMSVLRWIVEVVQAEKSFCEAQEKGNLPRDECFDPVFLQPSGSGKRFPYWLSADATQSFHNFFKTLDNAIPKGWSGIVGTGGDGTTWRLSCLYFGDQVLWSKTGIRNQGLRFPDDDLLSQLNDCRLGDRLKQFRTGQIPACSPAEFRPIFERFCERYNAHPSSSMGAFPFSAHWSSHEGWKTKQP